MLETIVIEPQKVATKTIIWLHGLGADGHDFVDIIPALNLPEEHSVRFVFPHAPTRPITINGGLSMRAWFDIFSLERITQEDEAGLSASQQSINELIDAEVQQGISPDQIILAGFSQGGAMALQAGLRYPKPLAGLLVLSGYLPQMAQTATSAHKSHKTTPISILHGTEDPVLPVALGQKSYDILKALHYNVTWKTYLMGHEVCGQEIADIASWIQSTLQH